MIKVFFLNNVFSYVTKHILLPYNKWNVALLLICSNPSPTLHGAIGLSLRSFLFFSFLFSLSKKQQWMPKLFVCLSEPHRECHRQCHHAEL